MAGTKILQAPATEEIQFFDPVAYKAAIAQVVPDTAVRYLGTFQFNSPGATKWQEVCSKRGMVVKARKARVAWWQAQHQLVFVPTDLNDSKGIMITWSVTQRSGRMRLRSVFLHYGIEMLKNSAWQLPASVQELPNLGWCLVVDLGEAITLVEVHKKVAASMMEAATGQ